MNKTPNDKVTLDLRVGRLEGTMEQIQKDVQENSRVLVDLTQTIGIFKDTVMSKIGQATSPKWPIIVSIGSLVITILLLIGGGFTFAMSGQADSIKAVQSDVDSLIEQKIKDSYDHGRASADKDAINAHLLRTDTFTEDIRNKQIDVLKVISAQEAKIKNLEEQIKIVDCRRYNERFEKFKLSTTIGVDRKEIP